jgi:hypothetical protein
MANATSTELQELYVAYFGRAADPTGLDYWTEKGITTTKFAADMYAQAEFKDAYGSKSVEAQVNQIYKNLFDREADVTGLTYWTQQINLGNLKVAEIATHLIWAAKNNDGSADDKTALTNRTTAAVAYTAKVKETTAGILAYSAEATSPTFIAGTNIAEAISYLSGIDKDTASTAAGIAASVTKITNFGVPSLQATAKTLSLTTATDDLTGTDYNDTFNADNTAQSGDVASVADTIAGGLGTDVINIYGDGSTAAVPKITGVETMNLYDEDGAFSLSATDQSSVTTLNMHRGDGITAITLPTTVTTVSYNNIALAGDGGTTADSTLAAAATSTSLTINIDTVTAAGTATDEDLVVSGAALTTVTFNSKGSADTADAITLPGATTINLDVATKFTAGEFTTTGADATLNLSGAGAVNIGTFDTDIDVITSTGSGALTGTLSTNAETVVTLGSGNDVITTSPDGFTTANKFAVNAGAGTDTLVVAATADLDSADEQARYTNFESITAAIANANFSTEFWPTGITSITTTDTGFTKLNSTLAGAITVKGDTGGQTFSLLDSSGTSDVISFTTDSGTTATAADLTTVTVDGFETLNFTATTGSKDISVANLSLLSFTSGTSLTTVNVKGVKAASADIGTNGSSLTKITTLDASTSTGGVIATTGGQVGDLTVTGSGVADKVTVGAVGTGGTTTVNTGAGNDIVASTQAIIAAQNFNGGAGTDILRFTDSATTTNGALTISDGSFVNQSGFETVDISAAHAGDILFTLGGYANALAASTSDKTLKITAKAAVAIAVLDIITIDASALASGNAVSMDIKNTHAANNAASPITLTGSAGNDTITVEEAKAAANTVITVNGGAGNDTITVKTTASQDGKIVVDAGAGNDTIDLTAATSDAAVTATLITPGAGDDTIKLHATDVTLQQIVLGATAAASGLNTITGGFVQGANDDIVSPDAFQDVAAMNAVRTSNPGSSTAVENDVNLLVDITGGQDITTAAGLETALATGGEYGNIDMAASKKAVFVTAASSDADTTQHVFYATSDAAGAITIGKVATLAGLDIDTWHEDNFDKLD